MELIINAASQSSLMPFSENEAAMGMVPYIQRGEAIPSRLAGTTPNTPRRLFWIETNNLCILFLPNTEITEPRTMPNTQYIAIWLNRMMK